MPPTGIVRRVVAGAATPSARTVVAAESDRFACLVAYVLHSVEQGGNGGLRRVELHCGGADAHIGDGDTGEASQSVAY
jgi:hypothetical protein